MSNEMKECPFCGNGQGLQDLGHSKDCYFTLVSLGVSRSAIKEAWNRRPAIDESAKRTNVGSDGLSDEDRAAMDADLCAWVDPLSELSENELENRDVRIMNIANKYGERDLTTYVMTFQNHNLYKFCYELLDSD